MHELTVKESDIEQIEKLGAIYDQENEKWYVPENVSPLFFTKWLNIYYLNVPFEEKNIVKSLGAKFDFKVKKWFISKDSNINSFSKWLPLDKQLKITKEKEKDKEDSISLSQLLTDVSFAVKNKFTRSVWVKCEIAALNKHSSGHAYFELIETDKQGREVCKNRAIILKNNVQYLFSKFKIATDQDLKEGIKALFLIQVDYTIKFGLGLNIVDIDPKYTLGGMEEKILKIRKSLQEQDLFTRNKLIQEPKEFTKVAVISPNGAAGLGDFRAESDWIEKHNLCGFDYFEATFQGNGVNESIYNAIKSVENYSINNQINYDAIVLIRGGGAKTDLHFLNEYDIARAICESKFPVFVGIGHERDKVILDEIANKSFDTPSKVANFITNTIISNGKEALKNLESIKQESFKLVSTKNNEVKAVSDSIFLRSKELLLNKKLLTDKVSNFIKEVASRTIQLQKENCLKECNNIIYFSKIYISKIDNDLKMVSKNIYNDSMIIKNKELSGFKILLQEIDKYNTKDIFNMGFSLIRKNGKIIKSASELRENDVIEIMFKDGQVIAEIKGEQK